MKLIGQTNFPRPKRILLIQLRRIGDTLLGTPALRALATHFPDAKIDFIVEKPAGETLLGNPYVDRLLVAPYTGIREWIAFVRLLRRERYDWAIDFMSNPRSAQFAYLSRAKVRIGLDRRGRRWAYTLRVAEEETDRDAYAVDLRLDILKLMDVPAAGRELQIFSDQLESEEARRVETLVEPLRGRSIVAVATGSANPAKRYPADLTAKVIEGLRTKGAEVVLTAGPGEVDFALAIQRELAEPVTFLENARVPALAALYRKCVLYVGPDSGPKHVAVACGIPTVTIFGPGRPSNWNDPESTTNALIAVPCEVRPNCVEADCAKRECLRKIDPGEIVKAAEGMMKRKEERRN